MSEEEEGLTLVIEFTADEKYELYHLAASEDPAEVTAVAKARLLGYDKVAFPENVRPEVELLVSLVQYAATPNMAPTQTMADELLFTRKQLDKPAVRQVIVNWSRVFGRSVLDEKQRADKAATSDQTVWAGIDLVISHHKSTLKASIQHELARLGA